MKKRDDTQAGAIRGNTGYVFANLWRHDRRTFYLYLLRIPIRVATPFGGLLMARVILSAAEDARPAGEMIRYILLITAALALVSYLANRTQSLTWWNADAMQNRYVSLINEKRMTMDYENLLSGEGQRLLARAKAATSHWGAATSQCVDVAADIVSDALGFALYGGVISALNPWILLFLAASAAANYFVLRAVRKYEADARKSVSPIEAKMNYVTGRSGDAANGKDVRLFNMAEWLTELFHLFAKERFDWLKKTSWRELLGKCFDGLLVLLRDGAGYAVLIVKYLAGEISVGDFVFYFGAITGFSVWLTGLINQLNRYQTICLDIGDLRAFLDMPDRAKHAAGSIPKAAAYALEMENVSYRYPGADADALKNVNLTIRAGERLALVGENGAGKTTLACILCGLLTPVKGRVLLNGADISEYGIDDYQFLFSAVFQNIDFLPLSLEKNITLDEARPDEEWLRDCIRAAGLEEKIAGLPEGLQTKLVPGVNPGAVELSGGETQKLALARALYKRAPLLILDEPTAMLDPIAESETYRQYAAMTEGKTSVYISHRLASTRFCDRIVLIKNGELTESGTHDELMRLSGDYARMYALQSRYYRREALERRAFG